jgi:hypothetical protein
MLVNMIMLLTMSVRVSPALKAFSSSSTILAELALMVISLLKASS